jgi:hypothetical protein
MMDCNGHSPVYKSVNQDMTGRCVDPINSFGGDAEYGTPDIARFGGTSTSPVLSNPQRACSAKA